MKFRSERDSLVEALSTAGRAVSTRLTMPVLSGLLVVAKGNELTVTGTDGDLSIRVGLEAIGIDDGTAVLLTTVNGGARLVATDSYRLALRDLEGTEGIAGGEDILVPARALTELQRLITPSHEGMVAITTSPSEITFQVGQVAISTRLISGQYPDYRQLIPESYPNSLHLGKESLISALRRVRLLVKDNTTPVRLSMRAGGVDLKVVSQEVGEGSETVDGDFQGEDLVIAFNPGYLIEGIEAVAGDEVIIETSDATRWSI